MAPLRGRRSDGRADDGRGGRHPRLMSGGCSRTSDPATLRHSGRFGLRIEIYPTLSRAVSGPNSAPETQKLIETVIDLKSLMYNSHSNSIRSMTPALLLAVAIAVPASADYPNLATVAATDSVATLANPGYLAAAGSFLGNINGSAWELTALGEVFGAYSQEPWVYQGKSDDLDFGPFTGNPETTQGILTFATPQTGLFVLGLKGGTRTVGICSMGVRTASSRSILTLWESRRATGIRVPS